MSSCSICSRPPVGMLPRDAPGIGPEVPLCQVCISLTDAERWGLISRSVRVPMDTRVGRYLANNCDLGELVETRAAAQLGDELYLTDWLSTLVSALMPTLGIRGTSLGTEAELVRRAGADPDLQDAILATRSIGASSFEVVTIVSEWKECGT